jgi:hypothetical protein
LGGVPIPHVGVTSNVSEPFYDDPRIMGSEFLNPLWISSHVAKAGEHYDQELFTVIQNDVQNNGNPSVPREEERSLPM